MALSDERCQCHPQARLQPAVATGAGPTGYSLPCIRSQTGLFTPYLYFFDESMISIAQYQHAALPGLAKPAPSWSVQKPLYDDTQRKKTKR